MCNFHTRALGVQTALSARGVSLLQATRVYHKKEVPGIPADLEQQTHGHYRAQTPLSLINNKNINLLNIILHIACLVLGANGTF